MNTAEIPTKEPKRDSMESIIGRIAGEVVRMENMLFNSCGPNKVDDLGTVAPDSVLLDMCNYLDSLGERLSLLNAELSRLR